MRFFGHHSIRSGQNSVAMYVIRCGAVKRESEACANSIVFTACSIFCASHANVCCGKNDAVICLFNPLCASLLFKLTLFVLVYFSLF